MKKSISLLVATLDNTIIETIPLKRIRYKILVEFMTDFRGCRIPLFLSWTGSFDLKDNNGDNPFNRIGLTKEHRFLIVVKSKDCGYMFQDVLVIFDEDTKGFRFLAECKVIL